VETAFSLTPEQRTGFDLTGMLRVSAHFPLDQVAVMADALWVDLEKRLGVDRGRPETWSEVRPMHYQALVRSGAFEALGPRLAAIADAFLGTGAWDRPTRLGQPLVTFPNGGGGLPRTGWHFDCPPADCLGELPSVKVFTFLEPVRPSGGGTRYIEGSHRVAMGRARLAGAGQRLHSREMNALLRREEPWFAALFSQSMDERERGRLLRHGRARGVEVRVAEMTGAPGDAYVMHPAMCHAFAPNALNRPRMMLVQVLARSRMVDQT
jgi:hypothetical protein